MKRIRGMSMDTAQRLGFPTNPALPLLDIPSVFRGVSEIVDRILGMHCVAACAYGFSREKAAVWYTQETRQDVLTTDERSFLRTGVGNRRQFMIQIEGIWVMAWAIGLINELDFEQACSPSFVALLPDLKQGQSAMSLRSSAALRPLEELVYASDLAYCIHWAVRQADLNHTLLPGKIGPYVIAERRRALEWMLGSDAWDEVSLDT